MDMDIIAKVINNEGKEVDSITINQSRQKKPNSIHLSVVHRCQLIAERNSEKGVYERKKSRGEVSGGGRKPYKQKGSGRARQGSIRAPQWKGGGVVFGPNGDKKRLLALNKKSKNKALTEVIIQKAIANDLIVVRELSLENYQTKNSVSFLNNLCENHQIRNKSFILVLSFRDNNQKQITRAFRNLKNVEIVNSSFLNLVRIISSAFLIFTQKSFEDILDRMEIKDIVG